MASPDYVIFQVDQVCCQRTLNGEPVPAADLVKKYSKITMVYMKLTRRIWLRLSVSYTCVYRAQQNASSFPAARVSQVSQTSGMWIVDSKVSFLLSIKTSNVFFVSLAVVGDFIEVLLTVFLHVS